MTADFLVRNGICGMWLPYGAELKFMSFSNLFNSFHVAED